MQEFYIENYKNDWGDLGKKMGGNTGSYEMLSVKCPFFLNWSTNSFQCQ